MEINPAEFFKSGETAAPAAQDRAMCKRVQAEPAEPSRPLNDEELFHWRAQMEKILGLRPGTLTDEKSRGIFIEWQARLDAARRYNQSVSSEVFGVDGTELAPKRHKPDKIGDVLRNLGYAEEGR